MSILGHIYKHVSEPHPFFGAQDVCYIEKKVQHADNARTGTGVPAFGRELRAPVPAVPQCRPYSVPQCRPEPAFGRALRAPVQASAGLQPGSTPCPSAGQCRPSAGHSVPQCRPSAGEWAPVLSALWHCSHLGKRWPKRNIFSEGGKLVSDTITTNYAEL